MNPSDKTRFVFATVVAVCIGLLGVFGIAVTLLSPPTGQTVVSHYAGGLIASSLFLLVAYVIWLWGKRCGCSGVDSGSQICDLPPTKKS